MEKWIIMIVLLLTVGMAYAQNETLTEMTENVTGPSTIALNVDLGTPSITFRSTEDKLLYTGDVVEGDLKVKNKNNFTMTVDFVPPEELDMQLERTSVVLNKGDGVTVPYTIKLNKEGNYSSGVEVIYKTNESNVEPKQFTLQANMNFVDIRGRTSIYGYVIAAIVVLVGISAYLIMLKTKKPKKEDELDDIEKLMGGEEDEQKKDETNPQ